MDFESIPVVEKERRCFPFPDRRVENELKIVKKDKDRRGESDRRISRGVSREALENVEGVLREEQKILLEFIADKEMKKQQVFRFQLAAIAILAASLLVALPLFEKFIAKQSISNEIVSVGNLADNVFLLLVVFNVVGLIVIALISLTSVAVTRQITSFKTNIILAVRQLNCNREAIQDVVTARICGLYPSSNWRDEGEIHKWEPAHTIYTRHNKFPIDNADLRRSFMRRHRSWMVRCAYYLCYPFIYKYRKKCEETNCDSCSEKNNIFGNVDNLKCFKIKVSADEGWKKYPFNKYNDVEIGEDDVLPKRLIPRVLLFGYRAAYIRSADMMTVAAMSIVTALVALLLPLGNYYLWYRINIIPVSKNIENEVQIIMDDILKYATIFSVIDLLIIVIFSFHFAGIIDAAMNKTVALLKSEPNRKKYNKVDQRG